MALETNASHESDRGPWLVPRPRGHGRLAFTGGGETKTCLPLRNKPPTHWQRESPQPPILQLGISCRTSRFRYSPKTTVRKTVRPLPCSPGTGFNGCWKLWRCHATNGSAAGAGLLDGGSLAGKESAIVLSSIFSRIRVRLLLSIGRSSGSRESISITLVFALIANSSRSLSTFLPQSSTSVCNGAAQWCSCSRRPRSARARPTSRSGNNRSRGNRDSSSSALCLGAASRNIARPYLKTCVHHRSAAGLRIQPQH